MREPGRHFFLIARIVGEAREYVREAARQVADLVAGVRARQVPAHAALRIDRLLGIVAKAANPRRQSRCEQRQRHRSDQQHGNDDVEQPLERAVALGEDPIARFLDDHRAAHLVAEPDRMRS